nr:uncharacterized protein LOC109150389 [Ipomoea batatas]
MYGHRQDSCPSFQAEVTVGQDEEVKPAAEDHRSVRRQGYNPPGVGVFSRARPYGPWMIVMRKERRPAGPPQRQNGTTGIGNGGASTSGSRFAPLEETDDRDQIPTAIPDAVQVRENGERSSTDLTRVPHQSRADSAVAERSSPRTTNRGLRRAAKEDEHTVNRGEKGGAVVTTTRVQHSDRGEPASTAFDAPSNEHHGDPPDGLDCEGDVVMEIEDQQSSGAGGRAFLRVLKNLIQVHKPDILSLVEPKVSGSHATSICKKLGYSDWVRVEAVGFSGGSGAESTFVAFCDCVWKPYTSPSRRLWAELSIAIRGFTGPLMVAGDFNSVIDQTETTNYSAFSSQRCSDFKEWIHREGLIDLGFSGPKFTWLRGNSTGGAKGARLDRALCNLAWRNSFPKASVSHLPRISSDHTPLLLRVRPRGNNRILPPFRFQAAWLTHKDVSTVVQSVWRNDNFEKAYDRLAWDFINATLLEVGFSSNWIDLMMYCIRTPRMSISWDGERLHSFSPRRGIRQGDSMSPTIFVLCMEKLSQAILHKVESREWKGVHMTPACPPLSHLCFADDLVLFSEATVEQVEKRRLLFRKMTSGFFFRKSFSGAFISATHLPSSPDCLISRLVRNQSTGFVKPVWTGFVTSQVKPVWTSFQTGAKPDWTGFPSAKLVRRLVSQI